MISPKKSALQFSPKAFLSLVCILVLVLFCTNCQSDTSTISTPEGDVEISSNELLATLGEAYLFGYPLVLMDITKNVATNIEEPHPSKAHAPINQLGHYRTFPDHTMTTIVKPNVDTYYTSAWLDLAKEPQVLFMPATERYYLLPMLDAYSNVFASPGTRTTGSEAQTFLIVEPNWQGETPHGMSLIQAPTEMVWLLGRIQVNSPEDGATTVKTIQDQMDLRPLSAFGKADYKHPIGTVNTDYEKTIPVKAIQELSTKDYLNRLADLMTVNQAKSADSLIIEKMKRIGLEAGKPFDLTADNLILNT